MFTERLNLLFQVLSTTNLDIAACAGCDRSNISRLRSGARIPKPTGVAAERLASGICTWADEHHTLPDLRACIGADADTPKEQLPEMILTWLYADMPFPVRQAHTAANEDARFYAFGQRLSRIMDLCGLSSVRLSQLTDVDASQISRFRNGARKPKPNSKALARVSAVILQRAAREGRLQDIADLTGISMSALESPESGAAALFTWLQTGESAA